MAARLLGQKIFSRIVGVERLLECINENKLDVIVIPDKRIYEVEGDVFIIVSKVEPIGRPPLTLKQVKQLWTLVEETGYNDMHDGNYSFIADGKIVIIDPKDVLLL